MYKIFLKVLPWILSANFSYQLSQGDYSSALTSLILVPVMAHALVINKPKEEN